MGSSSDAEPAEYEFVGVGQGAISFEWDSSASSSKGAIYVKQIDVAFQADAPAGPAVAEPVFGLDAGTYAGTQSVAITCETEGATIYYTTDGTTVPTAESTEYTTPISITETTTIKAIAIKGEDKSEVATAAYTIVEKINGGTAEKPLTIAEAINLINTKAAAALAHADNKVYVKGSFKSYVGDIDSYKQLSYWLTDGTNDFEVYQGKYLENAGFDEDFKAAIEGKIITLYGNIKKYTPSGDGAVPVYEFDRGNYVVKVETPPVDIVVNPEDITDSNITTALTAKSEGKNVRNITINLAEGGTYTISASIVAPANVTINGNGATVDASGLEGDIITLNGSTDKVLLGKDGDNDVFDATHFYVESVTVKDITMTGLKGSFIRDAQKTLLATLTIENANIQMPSSNKQVINFNSKGYVGNVVVKNSTIWAKEKNNGYFAQYGSRPNNFPEAYRANFKQLFDIQNSTFVWIANGQNFCNFNQKGTANNGYTLKNNIFVDCGKNGQVIQGINSNQKSTTPAWDVDNNVFNWGGKDVSEAEAAGTSASYVKNSIEGVVTFTDAANGDFNGTFTAAPVEEPVEESASRRDAEKATLLNCGDPRWTILWKQGYTITIAEDIKFGSATADKTYAGEGTVVTITATANPADKFEVKSVKVEGKTSDLEVVVTPDAETPGKFTFTMPADAVVVSATFQRIAEDIIVNPEDINDGDITAAINAKIEALAYTDPQTEEKVPGRVKDITINLAEGEAYTVAAAIKAPANVTINGNGATIDASGADANFIELQGSSVKAIKADGETESDHYLIDAVTINEVTVNGLKKAIIRDTQKTLLKALTIENSVIEASDGKPALDFDGKGYIEQVTVNNSTVWSSTGTNKFFAKYGSRPKNLWSGDDAGPYTVQGFDVQNSTFVNIANSKNFCDISQKGTVNNVYTLKNNIFVNCGKSGQVVVGFNGGQTSATPVWDVDGNVFNYDGNDVSAAEVKKAGQKADEDIVKNSLTCRVLFSDVEKPDFGGILVLAPGTEAPETLPGDPRWLLSALDGNTITVQTSNGHGTASAQYPYAIEGEEVGLTVKPEDGYEVESIVILDADGYVIGLVTGDTFTMPGQDVIIYVGFKKTATGIDAIENDADFEEGEWYTINGVRVDQPTKKGLYIHNGRKVVIK